MKNSHNTHNTHNTISRSNNSSLDSPGEDLSFDDSEYIPTSSGGDYINFFTNVFNSSSVDYKTLKQKKDQYISKKSSINKRKKQLEDDKMFSRWTSVYYTFFNNTSNNNGITLNELDLRCKFSFKCDEIERQQGRRSSSAENTNSNQSYADLKRFIDKYSSKRRENFFHKVFKRKTNKNTPISRTQKNIGSMNINMFRTHNPAPKNSSMLLTDTNQLWSNNNNSIHPHARNDHRAASFHTIAQSDNNFVALLKKEIEKAQEKDKEKEKMKVVKETTDKEEESRHVIFIGRGSNSNSNQITSSNNNLNSSNINTIAPPTKANVFSHNKRTSILSSYDIKDAENILKAFVSPTQKESKRIKSASVNTNSNKRASKINLNVNQNLITSNSNKLNMSGGNYQNNQNNTFLNISNTTSNVPIKAKNKFINKIQPVDLENLNLLISNKHSFLVELDRYSSIFRKKKNHILNLLNSGSNNGTPTIPLKTFEHFLDFRDCEAAFESINNKSTTLLGKFGSELEKVDTMSRKVQAFTTNVLDKLDSSKKIEI